VVERNLAKVDVARSNRVSRFKVDTVLRVKKLEKENPGQKVVEISAAPKIRLKSMGIAAPIIAIFDSAIRQKTVAENLDRGVIKTNNNRRQVKSLR
jgi:hypothetical protein